jgi:hypothetical protein
MDEARMRSTVDVPEPLPKQAKPAKNRLLPFVREERDDYTFQWRRERGRLCHFT